MKGVGVSPGISIGRARWVVRQSMTPTGVLLEGAEAIQTEVMKFRVAVQQAAAEVSALIGQSSAEAAAILETHIEMITDPQLESDVLEKIEGDRKNAVDAVHEVAGRLAETFRNMEDAYFRERAADIEDIGGRIVRH